MDNDAKKTALRMIPYTKGKTGAPILAKAAAFVEYKLVATVEKGDHSLFVRSKFERL
jgi:flavin reductase (DIM6/NTAB) family NADH-FMN oxidoreductase RutF